MALSRNAIFFCRFRVTQLGLSRDCVKAPRCCSNWHHDDDITAPLSTVHPENLSKTSGMEQPQAQRDQDAPGFKRFATERSEDSKRRAIGDGEY